MGSPYKRRAAAMVYAVVAAVPKPGVITIGEISMNKCPLCGTECKVASPDFGRGQIIVDCQKCGGFETHKEAIVHIESDKFGEDRRKRILETVKEINRRGGVAEIIVNEDGTNICARAKNRNLT